MATVRTGNRPVLLIVDFQAGVVAQAWDAARIGANVAHAVERARAQGVPVVWVQHEDADMPRGSPSWQFAPGLQPADAEVRIYKRFNSAFEETPLEQELSRLGATRIVLAGAMSSWCIRTACYAALEHGYDLTLLSDAHTTADIGRADGTVIAARDVVDELNVAMTWQDYPGRQSSTAAAADVLFD